MAWEIFTFGNGDSVTHIFMAVKGIMVDHDFKGLLTLVILISLFWSFINAFFEGNKFSIIFKSWLLILFMMYGLFVPKVDVIVRDEVKNTQQLVEDVPWGLGAFASVFSSIQASLAKKFDEYFSMPDDLKFTRSGYAWGLSALDTAPEMVVMDPYLSATIASFLAECTFNEIVAGVKDYNDILTSDDMLSALSTQDTALYSKIYSEAHPGGESKTCKDVYSYIQTALPQHVANTVSPYFARKMTGLTGMDATLTSMVLQKLGYAGQYFLNVSLSGQKMLEQAVLFNMFPAALDIYAVEYGGMPGDYASTMASKRAVANWAISAELAKKYIPTIRQILEALVYGLFPLMFLMMLLPMRGKAFGMYLTLLFWLTMWAPMESIINYIACLRAKGILEPVLGGHYNMMYLTAMSRYTADAVAMAGSLLWLVPILSFAVAKGSEYALVRGASAIAGAASGAASSASAEVSSPGGLQALQKRGAESTARTEKEFLSRDSGLDLAGWAEMERTWTTHEEAARAYYEMMGIAKGSADHLHSATNRVVESTASSGVGNAGTRMKTGEISGQRQVQSQLSFDKVAQEVMMTPGELQATLTELGLKQDFGNLKGLEHAYDMAKDNGFKGDLSDFVAMQVQLSRTKAYQDAAWAQRIANEYYGGNLMAMLSDQIAYHQEMIQGIIQKGREYGFTPEDFGRLEGHMKALNQIGKAKGIEAEGERTFIQAEAGKVINEGAKFSMLTLLAQKLGFKGKDSYQKLFNFLKAHHGEASVVLNADEAKHLSNILGKELPAGDYRLSMDDRGNLVFADAKSGTQVWKGSKVESTSLSFHQAQRVAEAFENSLKSGDKSALAVVSALKARGIDIFDENGNFDRGKYAQWLTGQNVKVSFGRDAYGREVITSMLGDDGIIFRSASGVSTKDINLYETTKGRHYVGEYIDPYTGKLVVGNFWGREEELPVYQLLAGKVRLLEGKLLNLRNVAKSISPANVSVVSENGTEIGKPVSTMKVSYSNDDIDRTKKLSAVQAFETLEKKSMSIKGYVDLSEKDIRVLSEVAPQIRGFSPGQAEILISGEGTQLSQGGREIFIPADKLVSIGDIPIAGSITDLVERKVASAFDGEKAVEQSLGKYEVGFSGNISFDPYNRSRFVRDNIEWSKGVHRQDVGTEGARWFAKNILHASDETALRFANKVAIVGWGLNQLGGGPMLSRKTVRVLGKLFEGRSAGRTIGFHP